MTPEQKELTRAAKGKPGAFRVGWYAMHGEPYHVEGCPYWVQVRGERGSHGFDTAEGAEAAGHPPCKQCGRKVYRELVGRVLHDLDGKHYVETFEGTYELPTSVWDAAAAQCREEGLTDAGDFTVGGRLAKVALDGGNIVGVSFLCDGRRYPETMAIVKG